MPGNEGKETDDVSGVAVPLSAQAPRGPDPAAGADDGETAPTPEPAADPDALADPPAEVAELAAACTRFVAQRYGVMLDFTPETLSLVDQYVRDARKDLHERPEAEELVQTAAGAYLGEVIRRQFGARWFTDGNPSAWRLYLSTVYCAFNPIGMVREALLQRGEDGWHAHFELDPGERELIDARLAALPEVDEDEYYAPTTRFDVVHMVVEALREHMRSRGLGDVRFTAEDYA